MSNSKTVLMLSDNPGDDYVARLRSGANRACSAAGLPFASVNLYGTGRTVADVLDKTELVGIILTPPLCDDRHVLAMVESRRVPFVRIAPMLDLERGHIVIMDELQAASAITSLLTARGHQRIAILRGPNSHLVSMRRYNGYALALGAKRLRVDQSLVAQGDFTRESGREQAAKLFAANPTAIFACNDEMAAGIVDAARAAGIAIPEKISLVGYDDNAVAATLRPRLTTVRQPLEAMGEEAGRQVAQAIKFRATTNQHSVVPFEIIERDSVADVAA